MRATFVNLHRDFTTPFVNCNRLMNDRPDEPRFFLCLGFMPNDVPLGKGGGRDFIHPFVWEDKSSQQHGQRIFLCVFHKRVKACLT